MTADTTVKRGCRKCKIAIALDEHFVEKLPRETMPLPFLTALERIKGIGLLALDLERAGIDVSTISRKAMHSAMVTGQEKTDAVRWICAVTHS